MKTMWIAVGAGAAVAIVGAVMMALSDFYNLGVILVLGGLTVAVMGGVIQIASAFMDERARQAKR